MSGGDPRPLRLIVVDRKVETDRVISLRLAAADGEPLPGFEAGQFLTFRVPAEQGRAVPRNYTLSGDPGEAGVYRISVMREEGAVGSGPGYIHDEVSVGTLLRASGPKGRFVLDRASRAPVLLLAQGIGITPIMAMASALAREPARAVVLVHERRPSDGPAPFRDELKRLAAARDGFELAFVATGAPGEGEREGSVDLGLLREFRVSAGHDVYMCGPAAFLHRAYAAVTTLGCRPERIFHETFGPAVTLAPAAGAPCPAPADATERRPIVTFALSGRALAWDPAQRTLLDFCEAQGLSPPFSCRNGICNTCLTAVEGPVTYVEDPLETPAPGFALLCCSVPAGPVTVRL